MPTRTRKRSTRRNRKSYKRISRSRRTRTRRKSLKRMRGGMMGCERRSRRSKTKTPKGLEYETSINKRGKKKLKAEEEQKNKEWAIGDEPTRPLSADFPVQGCGNYRKMMLNTQEFPDAEVVCRGI